MTSKRLLTVAAVFVPAVALAQGSVNAFGDALMEALVLLATGALLSAATLVAVTVVALRRHTHRWRIASLLLGLALAAFVVRLRFVEHRFEPWVPVEIASMGLAGIALTLPVLKPRPG